MTAETKTDQWCNCQDTSTWHPAGDTPFCPKPPVLLMGQDVNGRDRIIQAEWSSGVRVDWYRQINIRGQHAYMTIERARERAAEMEDELRDLRRAADWLEKHLDDMTGYAGETA